VELVLGTHHLLALGGSDTYLLTVAEQLQRLGHGVTIHAIEQGETAAIARDRGLDVAAHEGDLPDAVDAVLTQDAVAAYELAAHYPDAPQLFVCHSEVFSIDRPPQLPDVFQAIVVMSERVRAYVDALSTSAPVERLRQPVDTERFVPRDAPASAPRQALVVGNYASGERGELVAGMLADAGIEVVTLGAGGATSSTLWDDYARADLVVGKGRVIVEAMACGRPALVCDVMGMDGWVTSDRYRAIEADAFAGQADATSFDAARFAAELQAYDASTGLANRDLALHHHRAIDHAQGLVGVLERIAGERPPARERDALRELALLTRQAWIAESAATWARRAVDEERAGRRAEVAAAEQHAMDMEREARAAHDRVWEMQTSREYRLGERLRRWRRG
jgi:glycosyltransferase involved in cell wall biosynthesis